MGAIQVNTDTVVNAAQNIRKINNDIRDLISSVESAMNSLDNAWDGNASTNAVNKYNSIKNAYCDNRYHVIENYVNFLLQQVGEGYDQTETTNKSLADAFK